jgi:hypothetical protein
MKVGSKNIDRDKMAVELYFSVLRSKKAKGVPHKEARDEAYDAVELRYNISPKRLRNIIYDNHDTLNCDRDLFLEENRKLIKILEESNDNMKEIIQRSNDAIMKLMSAIDFNDDLINVLKEVSDV